MTVVGIRQLRQNASAYLRLVEAGETIEITDRGRPVALWVPIRRRNGIARLEAESRLSDADGDVLDLGPALPPASAAPSASSILASARRNER